MTIAQADLEIAQGTKQRKTFTIYSDVAQTVRLNLSTALEVRFSARSSRGSDTVLFSQTATNGQIGNDWTNGVIAFDLTEANTLLLRRDGVYDLTYKDSSGARKPLCYGDLQVIQKAFA